MSDPTIQKVEGPELGASEADRGAILTPRVDILETENELLLFADLPGVAQDAVDIRFENGELAIHARRAVATPAAGFARAEVPSADYFRSFRVSDKIDASRISAELKHGVLQLKLPKQEIAKPRKIAVVGG
jgi:HSP20 family protein